MSLADFDEEYEPFYDFSPTYEEDFVGKTLTDFDLSEEQAKPAEEIKTPDIPVIAEEKETNENDDDWEDIDVADDDSTSFQMISKGSNSEFTVIDQSKIDLSQLSQSEMEKLKALDELSSHLSKEEAQVFMNKNLEQHIRPEKMRIDARKISKVEVLDTGELKLPDGRVIGHRAFKHEYRQFLPLYDS